jgi:hypothetical protein
MVRLVGIELTTASHEVEAVKALLTANDTKLENVVSASSSKDDGLDRDGTLLPLPWKWTLSKRSATKCHQPAKRGTL